MFKIQNKKILILSVIRYVGVVLFVIATQSCNDSKSGPNINFLWQKSVHQILKDPLWKERDAYDAGHFLMIPLHASFASKDQRKIDDFQNFFDRFMKNYEQDDFHSLNTLTRVHFLYLASQYLTLNKTYNGTKPQELVNIVIGELKNIWEQPAWQWKACNAPSFQNMASRIKWKLQNQTVRYSYCRGIIDEELFAFAIASDTKFILEEKAPEFIEEILNIAYKVFKSEVVLLDIKSQKWLFQPGVWEDHPDYAYAGHTEIKPNLEKKPMSGIAWDTSHFHRFPLWLISLQRGFEVQGKQVEADYFKQLQYGLARQFLEKVLVAPSDEFPNYRTKNFMDGYNGIYRYGYPTQGEGRGYGPYELSGTMLLGWWAFLPEKKMQDVYCYISSRFPLSEEEIKVYLGPDTTRDRHPLIKSKAQFEDGLLESTSKLICKYRTKFEN